jgi:hypothetical protein
MPEIKAAWPSSYLTAGMQQDSSTRSQPYRPASANETLQYSPLTSSAMPDEFLHELNPTTPSQQIRLQHRASSLIQRLV